MSYSGWRICITIWVGAAFILFMGYALQLRDIKIAIDHMAGVCVATETN